MRPCEFLIWGLRTHAVGSRANKVPRLPQQRLQRIRVHETLTFAHANDVRSTVTDIGSPHSRLCQISSCLSRRRLSIVADCSAHTLPTRQSRSCSGLCAGRGCAYCGTWERLGCASVFLWALSARRSPRSLTRALLWRDVPSYICCLFSIVLPRLSRARPSTMPYNVCSGQRWRRAFVGWAGSMSRVSLAHVAANWPVDS